MNVNQELKVLLKEYNGILLLITVKMKTGAHNPLGSLKMRKIERKREKMCAPVGA